MSTWTREELADAFAHFQQQVQAAADSGEWSRFADLFVEDATYVEHAYGRFSGREEIREWVTRTMTSFPGNEMVAFPANWVTIDVERGWVICEIANPMRDPGDGSVISPSNLTILRYAGNGMWREEEDVYNPATFATAVKQWLAIAAEHGQLPEGLPAWATQA
ncbi:polyketide cyclase [Nocardioides sp. Soil797]|nr:polyketide cyclase [Nocardioides sp. Soil797]